MSENILAAPAERFVLQFPSGSFLFRYTQSAGLEQTACVEFAKLFREQELAAKAAEMFGCRVRPVFEIAGVYKLGLERRRHVVPTTEPKQAEIELVVRCLVEHSGGAVYIGIQSAFEHKGVRTKPLVLFSSRKTGSTLALPLDGELTSDTVRRVTHQSDLKFAESNR
jgi:hypothetical protein